MKRKIIIFLIIFLTALIVSLFGAFFFIKKSAEAKVGPTESFLIEVKKGDTIDSLFENLDYNGANFNHFVFYFLAKYRKITLKQGFYEITKDMDMLQVMDLIDSGKIKLIKVTIPEGWRTEQIAERLDENKILEYNDFVTLAKQDEGKLFPDTYFFNPRMTPEEVIEVMRGNFDKQMRGLNLADEDLIIASIVEREAINDEERPLIAGIYKNRLRIKMKLEADPTVQFGRDENLLSKLDSGIDFKYWQPVTLKDYKNVDSVYNTYLISGLPPGPICNPGIKSIEATINYQKHDYLFFLQSGGKIYPAKTNAEHDKNRAKVFGSVVN